MPIQRDSDNEPDDNESISDLPVVLPKYQVSQAKLDHLARARQRKAELASEKLEERMKEREETLALSRGVKKVKDPVAKEVIKKEILKATTLRQPKASLSSSNNILVNELKEPEPLTPIQKTRKQPKIVLEDSEPEVIYVKVPKKKIVVQQSETESEYESVKPKSRARRMRKPRQPVETESEYESEYDAPLPKPQMRRQPLKPPTAYQLPQFQINF